MVRNKKNLPEIILNILKILSPALLGLFILITNILNNNSHSEGTYLILNNNNYVENIVKDIAKAKDNITCALFMYKVDNHNINNLHEPVPLITSAFVNAAKRGVKVNMIFEKSNYEDDLSNIYNIKTAKYLENNGINVVFDNISRKLHAKMCLIDNKIIYTGSHNFTYSAMQKNSESSVKIVSEKDAHDVKKFFDSIK